MQTGFIGLGAVVETAYLPAMKRLGYSLEHCCGFDVNPARNLPGIARCETLDALLAQPLERVFITTPSLHHLDVLQAVLCSPVPQIVVEKPIVATLAQIATLAPQLRDAVSAGRVLALDHWMGRTGVLQLALGKLDAQWQPETGHTLASPLVTSLADIVKIEGFLQEPSGFNAQSEPIALNFATGEPDTRQLRHPDGVILDTGTHVLAMVRETVRYLGGNDEMTLAVRIAKDRLGQPITYGDLETAEGEAHLQGEVSGIPLDIWLNKYAGPAGGQKGIRLFLRDGRVVSQDRRGPDDIVELIDGDAVQRWVLPGPIYEHCLGGHILGANSLFVRAPQEVPELTRRRLAEVELLLLLQQNLRGRHGDKDVELEAVCPECHKPLQVLKACGAVDYFCQNGHGLISKKRVKYVLVK